MYDDVSIISRALDAGAQGYISKTSAPDILMEAIETVLSSDNVYLSRDIAQILALDRIKPAGRQLGSLSDREYEIFNMLINGGNIVQISAALHLSSKSVSNYVTKIKSKLNVSTIAELVHLGYKLNIMQTVSFEQEG